MRKEINVITGEIVELPSLPPSTIVPPTAEENKARASALLAESDWVELPSVADPATLPYLINLTEIKSWRAGLRAIAVNPIAGNLEWAEKPQNIWQTE